VGLNSRQKEALAFHIIIMTIAIVVVILFNFPWPSELDMSFTEEDNLQMVNEMALEWNENATLFIISAGSNYDHIVNRWTYRYIDSNDTSTASESIYLTVRHNGTVYNHTGSFSTDDRVYYLPLSNWTLDAEEIVELLWQEEEFRNYLKDASNPILEDIELSKSPYDDRTTWEFCFSQRYSFGFDDLNDVGFRGEMDANTGEILDTSRFGSNPIPACCGIVLAIVLIINVLCILLAIKVNKKPVYYRKRGDPREPPEEPEEPPPPSSQP